jgi:hypothetical protein
VSEPDAERPAWLKWATSAVPPATLVVSLLVYFAWIRRIAQSAALGFDATILAEPSIPAYLVRSVGSLYVPLVVLTVAALIALWLDRRLRARLDDRRRLRSLLAVARRVPITVGGLLALTVVVSFIGPRERAYAVLAEPFLLAATVQAIRYGNSLRRAVHTRLPTRAVRTGGSLPLAESVMSGLLVALLLFAGVDGFAQVVGRGLAQQVIDDPARHTTAVIVYSVSNLQLDSADATSTDLTVREGDGFRHRYDGLRLAFVDGSSYFLISRAWKPTSGKIIVLRQDGIRLEFTR